MKKYKVTQVLAYAAVLIFIMLLSSSYLISTILNKLENYNSLHQAYERTYSDALMVKYHSEKLLTTTDIESNILLWKESKNKFEKSIENLNSVDSQRVKDTKIMYFWHIIKSESNNIEKKLSNSLFKKENILEKSLLRKLGEEFFVNNESESYLMISNLKNSLNYLNQYEEFLLEEIYSMKNEQQTNIYKKINETKEFGLLFSIGILTFFLILLSFIAKKIFCIEEDLYAKKVELEGINETLDNKVIEKTKQIVTTTQMLEEAQKTASIGSWILDITQNKLEWSNEIFNIFQIEKKNFQPSYEFFLSSIHPDDVEMVNNAFQNSLKTKESYDIEHRLLLKNGQVKYVRERGNSKFNNNGDAVYSSGTVQDITKEQNLRDIILEEKEQALQANRSKSDFLANMSHEIRTPLNAILGFVGLLKDECQEDTPHKYISTIEDSGKTLLAIIEDILDLSKIENNKLDIENIDFDVKKEFQTAIEIFKARAKEKNIMLNINIQSDVPSYLKSDPLRLKQIVSNLLSNAIKFTKHDKNIDVTISYLNENLTISVKDEGIGISQDKVDTIFEAFTQEDTSTTRKYGGTGLGLTISSSLVALLGGTLKLKSTKGEGSEFYFTIQSKIGRPTEETIQYSEDIAIDKHILLVEDNMTNQMFMKILFKKMKISYELADDGIEAIEVFKKGKFDAVLMDENMPNMNGIEATKHILKYEEENNLKHTPIIALTANALKGEKKRFLNAGMDDYLSKPLDKNKFIAVLNKICN